MYDTIASATTETASLYLDVKDGAYFINVYQGRTLTSYELLEVTDESQAYFEFLNYKDMFGG